MFTTGYCLLSGRQAVQTVVLERPLRCLVRMLKLRRAWAQPSAASGERCRFGEAELVAATSARKRMTWGRDGFESLKVRECSGQRRLCASCSFTTFCVSISTKKENTGMFDIPLLGTRASGSPFVFVIELSFVLLLSSGSQNTTGAVVLVIGMFGSLPTCYPQKWPSFGLCVPKCGNGNENSVTLV
jgi:hypothetical protein